MGERETFLCTGWTMFGLGGDKQEDPCVAAMDAYLRWERLFLPARHNRLGLIVEVMLEFSPTHNALRCK